MFNDGNVQGRCAAARCILGGNDVHGNPVTTQKFSLIIREAVYQTRNKNLYHAQAYIGLAEEFMVKAHLCIPEGEENVMYSWLYNFQYLTEEYHKMYKNSAKLENEPDIYIFSDPQWSHPDFPLGLAFFDPEHNCACLLGLRYFGEHKKGTLTMAWGVANRNGFVSCHGGQKRYNLKGGSKFVLGVFGLSGSGKSTITHAAHSGKYDITVLHDDAFVISRKDASSVALEPAYFDKTQDYPMDSKDNKFLVTIQNNGVSVDEQGRKVLVTEDIRNGNGRAMKSKLWSPNRVDVFHEPANAIIWLMKDPTLPPVIKISDPILASTMGATLATKRTSAERLAPAWIRTRWWWSLMPTPSAPIRSRRIMKDSLHCSPTGALTATSSIPAISWRKRCPRKLRSGAWKPLLKALPNLYPSAFPDSPTCRSTDSIPISRNEAYKKRLTARMKDRVDFLASRSEFDQLPDEALNAMKKAVDEASKL